MGSIVVRRALAADASALVRLFRAHAQYEGAAIETTGLEPRLARAIEAEESPWILVAEADGILKGYASFNREFSTWRMEQYLHMDCLYLEPDARGSGVGRELVEAGVALAEQLGLVQMEWQTPASNSGAIRFYQRLGAQGQEKIRFKWRVQGRS